MSEVMRVYGRVKCVQCTATVKELDKGGYEYEYISLTDNPERANEIASLGYQTVPVIVAADGTDWFGYRPDSIKKHGVIRELQEA